MKNLRTFVLLLAMMTLVLAACQPAAQVPSAEAPDAEAPAAEGSSLAGQSFTFNGYAGTLQESQKKAWLDPFAELTGAKVNETNDVGPKAIEEQILAGNILVDVSQQLPEDVMAQCGKLYEPIANSINRAAVDPALITNDCGLPVVKYAFILAYNAESFPDKEPTSTADFFDNTNFPGRRGANVGWPIGVLEAAMLASGKAKDQVYPIDMNVVVEKANGLGDDLVLIQGTQALIERLVAGDVDMVIVPSSRSYLAAKDFPDIKPVFDGAVFAWDDLAVTKGSPNMDAAIAFLNYVAKPETQAALTEVLPYGATTPASAPKLDDLAISFYTENPANRANGINYPFEYYGAEIGAILDQWNAWTGSK